MNKLSAVLLILVVVSSWSVVTSRHIERQLYSALQKEQATAQQLEVEFGQLQLEQSTWGAHAFIERAATNRLHMHVPEPQQIQMTFLKEES